MMKYKVCMLGAFSVGKTSLVSRFVHSIFSERYHTTIGVKVDKKSVRVGDDEAVLLIWDIYGEDDVQKIRLNYIRGASGYLLVVDGTRPDTLNVAREIRARVEDGLGRLPFVLLVNKYDLVDEWALSGSDLESLHSEGWIVLTTSAKTGAGVEEGFARLAEIIASSQV
jgi:small GTP-binding protein